MERLERQVVGAVQAAATLRAAGADVDIPSWVVEMARFDEALNAVPEFLTPEQLKLRELGVLI